MEKGRYGYEKEISITAGSGHDGHDVYWLLVLTGIRGWKAKA